MIGCAVESDLKAYEAEQVRNDLRDQKIDERVEELMGKGADLYPFRLVNFREAMIELPDADITIICQLYAAGSQATAGVLTRDLLCKYWRRMARVRADAEVGLDA